MGKRGPKKQPAAVVKAKGNYRPSRYKDDVVNSEALDFVYKDLPTPPEYLKGNDIAIETWNKVLMQANRLYGYISYIDLGVFEQYCVCYSELRGLIELCKDSPVYYESETGIKRINPIYKEKDAKRKEYILLSREFGFTPSARVGIRLEQQKNEEVLDEFDVGI